MTSSLVGMRNLTVEKREACWSEDEFVVGASTWRRLMMKRESTMRDTLGEIRSALQDDEGLHAEDGYYDRTYRSV